MCDQSLLGKEKVEIHHIKPRKEGGLDTIGNLIALHQICHIKITHEKPKLKENEKTAKNGTNLPDSQK